MKWNPQTLAAITDGTLYTVDPDKTLVPAGHTIGEWECAFSIDTRSIQPGQVFVALQGEHSDGHAYVEQAFRKGVAGAIVQNTEWVANVPVRDLVTQHAEQRVPGPFVLQVADPLHALQAIARVSRRKHPIPLVGITGSNGKTTVKDMAASILAIRFNVLKSHKSFNNHIGLPLTLANMTEQHEVAVVEMGMNAPGELTRLAGIAQPDVGVITNIAPAHFGFFHSLEAIMQAKMELIHTLPAEGVAVLNADDQFFRAMSLQAPCALVTFGLSSPKSAHTVFAPATTLKTTQNAAYTFDIETPDGVVGITLPVPGRHNVHNALAATAILYALAQTNAYQHIESHHEYVSRLDMIKRGLEQFSASPMRMQVVSHNGVTFLNDAYNANPHSMAAALRTLKSMACSGKKVAVLGDMFELGEISTSAHAEVGALAADVPVNFLLLLGEHAAETSRGAQEAGMAATGIVIGESYAALAAMLADTVTCGDIVLIKASRSMVLERVLDEYMNLAKT